MDKIHLLPDDQITSFLELIELMYQFLCEPNNKINWIEYNNIREFLLMNLDTDKDTSNSSSDMETESSNSSSKNEDEDIDKISYEEFMG